MYDTNSEQNLILTGMPAAGKSTLGVLLAKETGRGFIDTDLLIQEREGRRLCDILIHDGVSALRAAEERSILQLHVCRTVIATGGSAVYSEQAMTHLKAGGPVIFLDIAYEVVSHRIGDLDQRGVARSPNQSLRDLFDERRPLYLKYADYIIDSTAMNHQQALHAVLETLR
ncbi:MAG: shikimate kinase [Deltaproteobacteria bacterium]|nr:shikimate kinase [Deltaproteobacteria bacterium]